jgi:PAS domain S-box-containing protein
MRCASDGQVEKPQRSELLKMDIDQSAEILRLRATVRDLLALSIIPEAWVGKEPPAIAADLADLLIGSLRLEFAFVRLGGPIGCQAVVVIRGDAWKGFPEWLQQRFVKFGQVTRTEIVTNVGGAEKTCRGVVIPIGVNSERGLIAAACDRSDFPDQIDQQLLSVAANNAATAFQNAFLINELRTAQKALRDQEQELRKAHDELEIKVAERTSELQRGRAYLSEAQRLSHTGSFGWNISSGEIYWSEETYDIFEYDRAMKPTLELALQRIHPDDRALVQQVIDRASQTGTDFEHEYRLLLADRRVKHVHAIAHALQDASGNYEFIGAVTDITERKRGEDALRASENNLRQIVDSVPGLLCAFSPAGKIELANRPLLEYFGKTIEELNRWATTDVIHPDDFQRVIEAFTSSMTNGTPFDDELRYRRADGVYRWFQAGIDPVRDADGRITGWYGLITDIEDRKRAEEKIRPLVDANILGTIIWNAEGAIIEANEAFLRLVQYGREDLGSGRVRWTDLTPPEWRECDERALTKLMETGTVQPYEKEYFRKDGSRVPVLVGGALFQGGGNEGVGFVLDLSEQKRAQEALRNSEAYLAEAQRLSRTGSWAWSPDGFMRGGEFHDIRYWSEECYRVLSFDPQDGLPRFEDFVQRIHPDDQPGFRELIETAIREKSEWEADYRIVHPDGPVRDIHLVGHPVLSTSGHLVEFVGTVIDVTERKRAEQALRRSEANLAEAQKLTHTGSWARRLVDRKMKTEHLSEEWYRIYGFDPAEGAPTSEEFLERVHPEDRLEWRGITERAIVEKADYDHEFRILLPHGKVKWIRTVGHPVLSNSGDLEGFVGSSTDITELKSAEQERARLRQLEADLAHTNRVSTLGEMAASLAHEIKQPIAAAITSANSCLEWLAHEPPNLDRARTAAARIDKYGNRAAEIIDRIRSFYKKSPPQRELVDVNGIIHEMLTLLEGEARRSSIAMRADLSAELPKIMVDRVQLLQVFMNLMLNAIEAMKDSGGELTVKSHLHDGQLQFSVSDTGVGLPKEKMDQIFSAFFTTKPLGSGMGLAISRSIVESHGGRLWAAANDGRGATFHFSLPIQVTGSSPLVA